MKQPLRRSRESKALRLLHRLPSASALQIGMAAVTGEPRAFAMPRKAMAAIGLSIAVELVRRNVVEVTPENRFKIYLQKPSAFA